MTDALSNGIAAPFTVLIGGRECKLAYPMHAAIVYRAETARIERSRPQLEDPDPSCICGARRSAHVGTGLIRLSESNPPEILCVKFRAIERTDGDSLYDWHAWIDIDLNLDPERWIACLWAGLHELQPDRKTWKAPFTLAELEGLISISAEAREIDAGMRAAMRAWFPKEKPKDASPNVPAAPDPDPAPIAKKIETNSGSMQESVVASESIASNS